jgi:hypothetical protein
VRTQAIVWTALPNGIARAGYVRLSVFVAPQLQTDEGGASPSLELFPDFANWPATLQGQQPSFSFDVVFGSSPPVRVTPDLGALSAADWQAAFDPSVTGVTSYQFEDYSTTPIHSFDARGVAQYVSTLYGRLGATSALQPPVVTKGRGGLAGAGDAGILFSQVRDLTACGYEGFAYNLPPGVPVPPPSGTQGSVCAAGSSAVGAARAFHMRPPAVIDPNDIPEPFVPTLPTLDFHQAVSALGSYPAVLRHLGLVLDLEVPLPEGLASGIIEVSVQPKWQSGLVQSRAGTSIDISPPTSCQLSASGFRAVPAGPDYGNGMLNLADTSRFSVIDLDTDGAAEQLWNVSIAVQNLDGWAAAEPPSDEGSTMAMTVPALRSTGPSIVWSGWGNAGSGLNQLAARQAAIAQQVSTWVSWAMSPDKVAVKEPALPVLQAEDIIRGHRFDVLAVAPQSSSWRSLHQRIGRYVFGAGKPEALPPGASAGHDEGTVVPGATTAAGTAAPPPPDLWVHESIARWTGWSLSAPRPGPQIDPNDQVHDNRNNPASTTADGAGQITPQVSASFQVAPGTLPKLRFGEQYRYRARAVDLAGNSVGLDDTDSSTATAPVPHYRYEPVGSPVLAQTAPLGSGEATLLVAVRNYQTTPASPVTPNGRWLFPPKVSELLAEEHGMLDGFSPGQPPAPGKPPSGSTATYEMLAGSGSVAGRADATLQNVPGIQADGSRSGTAYLPATATPSTPWLPDPLSSGASLTGFPGESEPTVRAWEAGPWPGADPLLVMLEAGASVGHQYSPGTAASPATETITLPPAGVLDLALSSAITSTATLGVYQWVSGQLAAILHDFDLEQIALRGQLWLISPYRALRLVHAVRLPLVAPTMAQPVVARQPGSVQAAIVDTAFVLDAASSSDIDAEATWTDPLDDPADPANDPSTATVTTTGHAFKASVPDPEPLGATTRPMQLIPAPTAFPIFAEPGVVHTIGDTKHHVVDYTCTATSRFAEFFRETTTLTLTGTTAATLSALGVDPATVVLSSGDTDLTSADYVVDAAAGTVALVAGSLYSGKPLSASFVPADTISGQPFSVQILSSARPKAPKVVRVAPAWSTNSFGWPDLGGGLTYQRVGGFVRVYLERPWFSSGAGELLGVVALDPSLSTGSSLPDGISASWVTLLALDPISVSSLDMAYPVAPSDFGSLADVPSVPYRPGYASPPTIALADNPTGPQMLILPYEVNYDSVSGCWYADVSISVSAGVDGPPPGHFVRLALVRFQPYSIEGAEISTVVLAGFAQPVPDRLVSVVADTADATNSSVFVSVSGPGYYGWRPPNPSSAHVQSDYQNAYAPRPYSGNPSSDRSSSTMIVEVQVQDESSGLSGDLGWQQAPGLPPVMLTQTFEGTNEVIWSLSGGIDFKAPAIQLPAPLGSSTPMRLRISELDYYPFRSAGVPAAVDTSFRRPFVALIPL